MFNEQAGIFFRLDHVVWALAQFGAQHLQVDISRLCLREPFWSVDMMEGVHDQQAGQTGWAMGWVLVAAVVGLMFWKWSAGTRRLKVTTPPGSMGWPLVGETLEFLRLNRVNDSIQFYKTRVAKYGETFTTHLFLDPTVSLGAADGNKFLFANENKLVQNSWPSPVVKLLGKDCLANKVGDEHKKARRLVASFFDPEGLHSFVPRIEDITRDHIAKHWEGKDSIRGVAATMDFAFAVACDLFASLKDNDPRFHTLHNASKDFLRGIFQLPIDLPGTVYRKGRLGRETMCAIIETLIADRKQELEQGKASQQKDLLTVMLTTPNEEGVAMSNDEITDNLVLMLFAGHDTSSIAMAVVLKYLSLNPECLAKVVEEQREIVKGKNGVPLDWNDTRKMKYTWQVVQETLRLQPPAQSGFRVAIQNFQYAGYTILKGWKVHWATARSHYDPKYFPNPEKFDPSRFEGSGPPPYVWIPFGGGPHICLGNEFARTEMMVFLHHIVEWKMVDPLEPISIDPMPIFKKGLELQIQKKEH